MLEHVISARAHWVDLSNNGASATHMLYVTTVMSHIVINCYTVVSDTWCRQFIDSIELTQDQLFLYTRLHRPKKCRMTHYIIIYLFSKQT